MKQYSWGVCWPNAYGSPDLAPQLIKTNLLAEQKIELRFRKSGQLNKLLAFHKKLYLSSDPANLPL
jgi:hypothetical protein